jgi:transcriptional regulator with GAF, ATPase, and Fis domain
VPAADDSLSEHSRAPTQVLDPNERLSDQQMSREKAVEILAAGIQDVTNEMVENFQLNALLRMILETIYRALGARRVIFCLRDARGQVLTGRLGLGPDAERLAPQMRVDLASMHPDLLAAVCLKGADTLIADATQPKISQRLPGWFSGELRGQSFLLLPLMHKGVPLGLIYADKLLANSIDLGEKELSLLRTLRNQAVMAFRQAG